MLLKKAVSTLLLGALCASLTAQADVKIGVITSSTGPIGWSVFRRKTASR